MPGHETEIRLLESARCALEQLFFILRHLIVQVNTPVLTNQMIAPIGRSEIPDR